MGSAHPMAWAEDKRSKARRYAEGEVAAFLRAAVPILSPGVPVAAWIGVACNGSRNENTTGWIRCDDAERAEAARTGRTPLGRALDTYAREGLHELGPFGVEALHAPRIVGGEGSPWWIGAFCSDNPWLGRPPALTTDAPEPTVMGYVQAARAWLCADPFRDLIDGARDLLRRAEAAPPAPPPDRTPEAPTGRPRAQEAEPSDVEPPEGLDPQTLRPSDPPAPEHPTQGDGGVPSEADAGGVRP